MISPLRIGVALLGVGVAVGAVVVGRTWLHRRQAQGRFVAEQARQREEIRDCQERLLRFRRAWARYRRETGRQPPDHAALVPRLVDPRDLTCPTADRWRAMGHPLSAGQLRIGRRAYPVTYGFLWLAPGRRGQWPEDAPLVVCESHREALFRASFRRMPRPGELDDPATLAAVPAFRRVEALIVTTDGRTRGGAR